MILNEHQAEALHHLTTLFGSGNVIAHNTGLLIYAVALYEFGVDQRGDVVGINFLGDASVRPND